MSEKNTELSAEDNVLEEEEEEEQRAPEPVPEPIKSPRKVTIADRSIKGCTVFLIKNQYPRGAPKRYRVTSIDKLLTDAHFETFTGFPFH